MWATSSPRRDRCGIMWIFTSHSTPNRSFWRRFAIWSVGYSTKIVVVCRIAAYCYTDNAHSMVCLSVCLSARWVTWVKHGRTDRESVLRCIDWCSPKKDVLDGVRISHGKVTGHVSASCNVPSNDYLHSSATGAMHCSAARPMQVVQLPRQKRAFAAAKGDNMRGNGAAYCRIGQLLFSIITFVIFVYCLCSPFCNRCTVGLNPKVMTMILYDIGLGK